MHPKQVVSVRFDPALLRELRQAARADGRIFGPFVRALLRGALDARALERSAGTHLPQPGGNRSPEAVA
jgi:hypothetical protein